MKKKKLIIIFGMLLMLILISGGIFIIKNKQNKENIISDTSRQESQNFGVKNNLVLSSEEKQQFGINDQADVLILTQEEKTQYNIISENRVHFMTDEEKARYNIKTTEPIPIEMVGSGENSVGPLPRIYLPPGSIEPTPIITEETDSDSDGLNDIEELKIYGTDPKKSDTDGDGYLDGDEVQSGYNPAGEGKLKK
jgi:hypothetical protein